MTLSLAAPALLPLALVRDAEGAPALLGIALQHPPVSLVARPAATLTITGARADLALRQAQRFLTYHGRPAQGEIEIDMAIPRAMGLGSDAMLGLSVARALAALYDLPTTSAALAEALELGPDAALAAWAFEQGGLLLVRADEAAPGALAPLRRAAIAHPDTHAWAFVLVLPRTSAAVPQSLEQERMAALLATAPQLDDAGWHVLESALWPAVERDDITAFGAALGQLQQFNQAVLPTQPSAEYEEAVLATMRAHGAATCGPCLSGLGLYALVRGADATIRLRNALREQVGFFGGSVMAAICDTQGLRLG